MESARELHTNVDARPEFGTGAPTGAPLGPHQREVLARVHAAEAASIAALPSDDPLDARRRARVDATLPEMLAQPEALEETWAANAETLPELARLITDRAPWRACLVGAGDSLAVMTGARLALEMALGIPCEPVQSLELAHYTWRTLGPRTLVFVLSSSGETTRSVEAALVAQNAGACTVALTNTPGSTLDAECDRTLLVRATRKGWPTQSSTAALGLLLRLASMTGSRPCAAAIDALPELMAAATERAVPFAREFAAREAAGRMYLFSGGGPNQASAVIGAAKVKECTPDHALAIQVEEYHHYNSQKAGEPLMLLAPTGPSLSRACDTASEAHRFGGRAYAVTTEGEHALDADCDLVLGLPPVHEALSPMLYALPAQCAGYELAMAKFAAAEAAR